MIRYHARSCQFITIVIYQESVRDNRIDSLAQYIVRYRGGWSEYLEKKFDISDISPTVVTLLNTGTCSNLEIRIISFHIRV